MERLTSGDFTQEQDPFALFAAWFEEAKKSEPNDPNGMALSTVDADGMPNSRMVLLNGRDGEDFVFYTNTQSQKGEELLGQPKAAALFHWKSLRRQVRIRGHVSVVSDEMADAYFQSRPRDSRIGAWASQQSRPLESRFALEKAVAFQAAKFGVGTIPRPPHWTGFRISPVYLEFWRDGAFRLHDRVVFSRAQIGEPWARARLYP
ncbi:pyridoxamine 5'-phosphate oxidase [Bosea sp. (in: a-proteobacteria)]|uniref:pyridoxamine 5'-phosphate oxidase n=1 Tax=Bosea sp. (in: a-proteobacteria) TaxID=1871050 RepID=UPI00273608BA|nr:pyridoxamine 5'-phosphate oxidase [Bosea sp. (in: a-proteobacteria)]MDP3411382.1 pyridoxamine 5'-phosphate oxidase [Bosea sp. (in: a-proteobacteria)]